MAAKMRDVAARAGVSVATVSRFVAGTATVSPATSDLIAQAIKDLSYVPNRLPGILRGAGPRTLALVVGNVRNPYFPELISGCETAAREAGFSLIFSDTDEDPDNQDQLLMRLAEERVAGILLAPASNSRTALAALRAVGIPAVLVDRRIDGAKLDTISVDSFEAMRKGVSYLIGLGHRRIGHIGGPSNIASTEDRRRGYLAGLADAGLEADEALMFRGDLREEGGLAGCRYLLALSDRPTAITTGNSLTTIGAMKALRAAGLGVPTEMSVLAFDDFPTAELLDPPLSAIGQPVHDLGRRAVGMLLERLNNPELPARTEVLQSTLIIRDSVAEPRTRT